MTHTDHDPAARASGWGADATPADPFPPRRPPRTRAVIAAVVIGLLAIGAYLAFSALDGADREDAGPVAAAGTVSVFDLREGDCFDDPGEADGVADEVADVTAVPCSQPHDLEVFLTFGLPMGDGEPFPDEETLERHVDDTCLAAFDAFVGTPFEESDLDVFTFEPTPESWEAGDREVMCALWTMDGSKLEGSARGSGR